MFQPLVPEAVPLVEALLHDLLATTHNLKLCKEEQVSNDTCNCDHIKTDNAGAKKDKVPKEESNGETSDVRLIRLQNKVSDLELLNKVNFELTAIIIYTREPRCAAMLFLFLFFCSRVIV